MNNGTHKSNAYLISFSIRTMGSHATMKAGTSWNKPISFGLKDVSEILKIKKNELNWNESIPFEM